MSYPIALKSPLPCIHRSVPPPSLPIGWPNPNLDPADPHNGDRMSPPSKQKSSGENKITCINGHVVENVEAPLFMKASQVCVYHDTTPKTN